nr:PREDICTED: uncharacterized protein LOC109034717 [Bemisia tabaci]
MRHLYIAFVLVSLLSLVRCPGKEGSDSEAASSGGSTKRWRNWKVPELPGWLQNIKEGKWPWKRRDDREFVKNIGKDLPMKAGDTVVTSLVPNPKSLIRPFLWTYAIDADRVVYFFPGFHKFRRGTCTAKVIDIRTEWKDVKMMNRKQKKNHLNIVGGLVAALMVETRPQVTLPYHLARCNGKHYVEYLSLGGGSRKGSWLSVMHFRVNGKCPVRAPLDANMLSKIFKTGRFTLKAKDKSAKDIELALPGVENLGPEDYAYELWPKYIQDLNLLGWKEEVARKKALLEAGGAA